MSKAGSFGPIKGEVVESGNPMEPTPRPAQCDEKPEISREHSGVSHEAVDAFVRLLGQNQRRLFLYIMSMVPNWNDAEEIIQETNLVLWREFARFDHPGVQRHDDDGRARAGWQARRPDDFGAKDDRLGQATAT